MNILNKKSILFLSLGSLMFNGCVAKNKSDDLKVTYSKNMEMERLSSNQVSWNKKSLKTSKEKDDCVDCIAVPVGYTKPPSYRNKSFEGMKNIPSNLFASNQYKQNSSDKGSFGNYNFIVTADDKNTISKSYPSWTMTPAVSSVNTSYDSYSKDDYADYSQSVGTVSIQVGAFRKYSGAEVYVDRYSRVSNRYKVAIKTGTKNSKPIHRVQIEGFQNSSEAKRFINRNGLSNVFLVK